MCACGHPRVSHGDRAVTLCSGERYPTTSLADRAHADCRCPGFTA